MAGQHEPFPSGVLFAQIEQLDAVQDYAPGQDCVRLVAVSEFSFRLGLFNTAKGCQTYLVDLGEHDLRVHLPLVDDPSPPTPAEDLEEALADQWFEIRHTPTQGITPSYAYAIFADAEPTYLHIHSIIAVDGPGVQPLLQGASSGGTPLPLGLAIELTGFHVGQGMCSLLHGGGVGYLLDAGAGTPVLRPEYRRGMHANGTPFVNEMRPLTSALSAMTVVLSHPDSDHWRLLDWDSSLLGKAAVVHLPAGRPALAFSAPNIKPKVVGLGSTTFTLNAKNKIEVLRASPRHSDRNSDCLVSVVTCDGALALLAGDYVYSRLLTDGNAAIASAAAQSYAAIVVPHHGDKASAHRVPPPLTTGSSIAYFSAGNHRKFGHPTSASLSAHQLANFAVTSKNTTDDILQLRLLP